MSCARCAASRTRSRRCSTNCALARGADHRLDTAIDALEVELSDVEAQEHRARHVTAMIATVVEGALLVRHFHAGRRRRLCRVPARRIANRAFGSLPRWIDATAIIAVPLAVEAGIAAAGRPLLGWKKPSGDCSLARVDTRNSSRYWKDAHVPGLSCLAADFTSHDYAPHSHDALVVAVTEARRLPV